MFLYSLRYTIVHGRTCQPLCHPLCSEADHDVFTCMQAADFLRDHQTMAAVSERLGTAVLGDVRAAPTNIEQARARKVWRRMTNIMMSLMPSLLLNLCFIVAADHFFSSQ